MAFVVFVYFYNTLANFPVCCLYSLVVFMKLKPVTGNFFSEFMFVQQRQTPNIAELVAYGFFRPQP